MNIDFVYLVTAAGAILLFLIGLRLGILFGRKREERSWKEHKLEPIVKDRLNRSRAVIGGQFAEQLAPYLPEFPFNPNECRFIGKPVDFLVFKGMDEGDLTEIVFVEVKSGKAKNLSRVERQLRDAVSSGRVKWVKYDVPEKITAGRSYE